MLRLLTPFVLAALVACSSEPPPEAPGGAGGAPAPIAATVISVEGELRQGERVLKANDAVDLSLPLEVKRGRAVLSVPNVGEVRLYPNTAVQFSAGSALRLLVGKIWLLLAPQTRTYEVNTENAVAGVRGTTFVVAHAPGKTEVWVSEGKVAVKNPKAPEKEVVVDAGHQVTVNAEEPPTPATPFAAPSVQTEWEKAAEPAAVEPAPEAPAPEAPGKPKVIIDRKAFEKQEEQGRQQKEALEKEAAEDKAKLKAEEEKEKKSFEKPREEMEKDLEGDVGMKPSIRPEKTPPKKTPPKDDETKDFLK